MVNANLYRLSVSGYLAVWATRYTVAEWAKAWPCYGPANDIRAEFDPRGDLVDLSGDTESNDPAGVAALVADLQLWGILQANCFDL